MVNMIKAQHIQYRNCHSETYFLAQYVNYNFKILPAFLSEVEKLAMKFLMKYKKPRTEKTVFSITNKENPKS